MSSRRPPGGAVHGAAPGTPSEESETRMQLLSVQRNYESMSRLMQAKQGEVLELQKRCADEQARYVSAVVQLEEARQRAEAAEQQAARNRDLPDQITALKAELQKLRFDASLATGKTSTLEDKLQKLAMAGEEREFGNAKQQRELEALMGREKLAGEQLRQCRAEAESLRRELITLGEEATGLREARAAARAAAAAAEQTVMLLSGRVASRDETVLSLAEDLRSLRAALHEERAGRGVDAVSLAAAQGQLSVSEGQLASLRRSLQLSEAGRMEAERALAQSVQHVASLETAAAGQRERVLQLQALLEASDEKLEQQFQALRGQTHQLRLQEGEQVERLQFQVQQNRALLADSVRQVASLEEALQAREAEARFEAEASASLRQNLEGQVDALRGRHVNFCHALIQRAEAALDKLGSLQAEAGRGLAELQERQERVASGLVQRIEAWEGAAAEQEGLLGLLASHVQALTARHQQQLVRHQQQRLSIVQGRRQAEAELSMAESKAASAANEAQLLRQRVQELEAALAREQAAREALRRSAAKQSEDQEAALAEARATAEERAGIERQRLSSRLDKLMGEVALLERSAAEARAAAAAHIRQEREMMQVDCQVLRDKLQIEARRADAAERANEGSLASLSRLHQRELETCRSEAASATQALQASRGNLQAAYSASLKLLEDMALVAGHLAKMGWQEAARAVEGPQQQQQQLEDGSGTSLAKLTLTLRLNFSYVTEAVQNRVRDAAAQRPLPMNAAVAPVAAVVPPDLMKEVKAIVTKLLHAEESLAPPCTCLSCLRILKNPVILVPCGHTLCSECLSSAGGHCVECGPGTPVQMAVPNLPLEAICAKFEFKLSALQSIQSLMAASTASAQPESPTGLTGMLNRGSPGGGLQKPRTRMAAPPA